jgi:DNA-binding response OmpR family regulator/DNA-binding CsgD family transcriptional regulator
MNNRILVVDDDRQSLMIVKSVLEQRYIVKACLNGQQALDVIPSFAPDVVLLDWTMPIMDGLQTLTAIKSNKATENIQAIMMTGYMTEQKDLLLAYNAGIVDFIKKPFDILELKARVNSVVQLSDYYKHQIELKNQELVTSAMRLVENNQLIKDLISKFESLTNSISDPKRLAENISDIKDQLLSKVSDFQWKHFLESFRRINPQFQSNLLQKHPGLTPAEIQLSTLIKLNLSIKEISVITHSTGDSIKVARARLRKKLGIEPETNLTSYLISL